MRILAFTGRAGSGKDLACRFVHDLCRAQNLAAWHLSLAEPLKRVTADLYYQAYGVPWTAFYGTQEEKAQDLADYDLPGVTGRYILQNVGTEGFRAVTPNLWVDLLLNETQSSTADLITVSDCRFKNEAEAIRKAGGLVVRLTRGQGGDSHASETELETLVPDIEIDNRDMTKDELRDALVPVLVRALNADKE